MFSYPLSSSLAPGPALVAARANFTTAQRNASLRVFELADCEVQRMIGEPCRAALNLELREDLARTLVIDLGGGMLDAAVVEVGENVVEVKAVAGIMSSAEWTTMH